MVKALLLLLSASVICLLSQTASAFTASTATTTVTTGRQRQSSPPVAFVRLDSTKNAPLQSSSVLSTYSQQQHRRLSSSTTRLYMGWGPDPIWKEAKLESIEKACPSGKSMYLTVSVDPETASEYKIPGQYVQVRPRNAEEAKPSFFAIASAPDPENAKFEFLVKQAESVEWLLSSKAGSTFDMSQVLGNGYPVAENIEGYKYDFPTQNIVLLAAGSGIAPLAAVIESQILGVGTDSPRTCRLYYGEQFSDDLCFVDQFAKWEEMGVQVVPVLSQEDSSDWQGRSGYVQNALEEDGIPIPRNSAALICGMKGMAEASKELLTNAGVFEGRVLFNF